MTREQTAEELARERTAKELARWHFTVEPELTSILWVTSGEQEPLRLLEVTRASERPGMQRGIEVFGFEATADVPYPAEVVEITEAELKLVLAGVLKLPEGWAVGEAQTFTREQLLPDQRRAVG